MEKAESPEEMKLVVAEGAVRLADPKYKGLNHALAAWVKYMFLLNYGLIAEAQLKVIDDLQGVNAFMEKNMRKWFADREAMGEVNTLRRLLAKCLQTLLGDVPEQFRVLMANSVSAGMLESLLEQAYGAKDLRVLLPSMEQALRDAGCGSQTA